MGFFSGTSSNKLVGTLRIKFYGEDSASVEYETDVENQEQKELDLVQVFTLYYAKMLFNLNRGEPANALIVYIQKAIQGSNLTQGKLARPNVLATKQVLVELKEGGVTKSYTGEYLEKSNGRRIIQTQMDTGGEGYYAPASTVMLLQWLINNLEEGPLTFLFLSLMGMNQYYGERGDYASMQGFNAAPTFGLSFAQQILSSDE